MKPSERIRVVIADDHPMMREGLAAVIESEPDLLLVGQASNGLEAIELYRSERADVILMDLQMPEMDGLAAITALRAEYSDARILVLTTYGGDAQAMRALRAGACGYLLKNTSSAQLIAAIRGVHSGRRLIDPEVATLIGEHSIDEPLSEREICVLKCVARGASNKKVAAELAVTEETIKTHMKSILSKLNTNDRTRAVMIALIRGILDPWTPR